MKHLVIVLAFIISLSTISFSQNGILPSWFDPTFLNSAGTGPAALGFVCTYSAGTTTPATTYSDITRMVANQNPIRLNAAGQPVNGSTLVSIYLDPGTVYKFNIYAAGTGNLCNGVHVGTLLRTRDNVPSTPESEIINNINNIRYCNAFSGATADVKIAACFADLPSTGGTADARGLEGTQVISANPFSGVTKPVTLLLGAATYTMSAPFSVRASNQVIKGLGIGQTVLRVASVTAVNAVEFNNPASGGGSASTINDVGLSDITVDCNRASQSDGGNDELQEGVILTKVVRGYFSNLEIKNCIYSAFSININSSDISVFGLLTTNNGRTSDFGGLLLSGTVIRCHISGFNSVSDTIAAWLVNNANDNYVQFASTGGRSGLVIDNSNRNVAVVDIALGTGNGVTIQKGLSAANHNQVTGVVNGYTGDGAIVIQANENTLNLVSMTNGAAGFSLKGAKRNRIQGTARNNSQSTPLGDWGVKLADDSAVTSTGNVLGPLVIADDQMSETQRGIQLADSTTNTILAGVDFSEQTTSAIENPSGGSVYGVDTRGLVTATGISTTPDPGVKNLRGTATVTAGNTTVTVTFGTAEPDTSYYIVATPVSSTGSPAAGSTRVSSISKSTGSFILAVEVDPGMGATVTFNWIMVR